MDHRITEESKTGKRKTNGSGRVKNGKKQKPRSSENIQPVGIVAVNLLYPIIQTTKSTVEPNILILKVHSFSATLVTEGFTKEDTRVLDAQRLGQSWQIRRAISVLTKAIKSELEKDEIITMNPATRGNVKHIAAAIQRK